MAHEETRMSRPSSQLAWRPSLLVALALGLALLAACAAGAPAPAASPAGDAPVAAAPAGAAPPATPAAAAPPATPAAAAAPAGAFAPAVVKVTDYQIVAGAGHYIAEARGYFQEAGLQVEFVRSSPPDMLPLMVSNQLDVGVTSVNAGLFNAFARGLPIRIVADHAANGGPGTGSTLVIRKDLVDDGTYRGVADLRGRKVASANTADATMIDLAKLLATAGLTLSDVDYTLLSFPDILAALENRAIDASYYQEPFVTIAADRGWAVRGPQGGDVYPDHQIGLVLYNERLLGDRDLGMRYMRGYVRGVRDYRKAMWDRDPAAFNEVVPILIERTAVKERSLFEKMTPTNLKFDPIPNVQTMAADQDWFIENGYQQQRVDMQNAVELSFVEQAIRELGAGSR
jgi:NitT/TauT family transport system substrate-binding protein